ncbi:nSTAND1 domain-containing NTPase [Brevirhabdus sp.]|uniref:nSTAND1 domain-containing NTPase n=1 Tax=Brevirhabdus sp. TaxID=2004514 RepID=UPI004057F0A0
MQLNFDHLLSGNFTPSSDGDWDFLRAAAQNLFKPKTPVDDDKLFAGRIGQINDLLDVVYEPGGHAIIFGERGVGKTSLAKIIEKKIAPVIPNINVPEPISCMTGDDFYKIWGNAFNNYQAGETTPAQHFANVGNPYEVINALNDLSQNKMHIFIFDEFDRVDDDTTYHLMADMLKHLSNNPNRVTIIIVGVGDTLLDLFGKHESIVRCCEQIKMPRMSDAECREIIDERIPRIGFTIDKEVTEKIIKLSQGLPGYVHLLGQLALKNAINNRRTDIGGDDLKIALSQALSKADHKARSDYYKAISSSASDNKYKEVLLACALAESNEMGYFFAGSVRDPYSKIRGKPMDIPNYSTNLSNLCADERGPALIKTGKPKRYQYRFANPLVQPLAIMIGADEGLTPLD